MSEVTQAATGAVLKPRARPNQPLHAAQVADALLRLSTVQAITGQGAVRFTPESELVRSSNLSAWARVAPGSVLATCKRG